MSKQDWWCAMHCTCRLQRAVKQCWWRCWGFPTQLRSPALSPLRWLFQYDKSEFVTKCAILMPGPVIQKPHAFSPINDILRNKLHNRDNFKVSFYLCIACQSLKMECLPPILLLWVGVNTGCWHPVLTPTYMSRHTGRCQHWVLTPSVDTYQHV